jgi:asparagine synthase (glutamine-hydrolysing)
VCGIAGFQGRFDQAALCRMSMAQAHRGPDDDGLWMNERAATGLAHRRLSILDPSPLGHQPMSDAGNTAMIVFNGEIYNFRELRAELIQDGHTFRTQSDTEVLVTLYRAAGESMLRRLNGIFAFAIYDDADRSVFLACDDFAVKPLYIHEHRNGFLFASELKAILASGMIDPAIDIAVLFRTLGFLWSPGGTTPIDGVTRVGPGEALRVKNGRVVRRWQWAETAWADAKASLAPDEAAEQVRDALRVAVTRQLVSDVPVGAFLSGGLDSSSIVAIARERAPQIECFTIDAGSATDAGATDDLPYARRAASHLGVKLHEVRVSAPQMAQGLERMVVQLDEPLADPAPINVLLISELARQAGVKVLLSGAGGDDVFSGYRRHRAIQAEKYWASLPSTVRRGLRTATSRLGQKQASGRRLAKLFAAADRSPEARLTSYFLWAQTDRIRELFADAHRSKLKDVTMAAPLSDYLATLPTDLAPLDRMLALEQRFFLTDHNLLYTDKMGMAAGVEIRVPFLDKDLVRLANRLPSPFKQRGREGKWILKKAMEPLLPKELIYRPKTGFGAPIRRWLRHEWREWVEDTLSPASLRNRGLFDPGAVARFVADDRAGRVDGAYTILSLICTEIWCRHFVDGQGLRSLHLPTPTALNA